ncbi:MAG: hypothetical protein R3323_00040 [Wenzhouxiangellaceae bacterium]|nr:hypothetical protein [Wenzhouxiangellaceae bacterium]
MQAFAERTGLLGPANPRRYLWTDAFAVCNYLELDRRIREAGSPGRHLDLALALVDQVHEVLGSYADDDPREGWLGGVDESSHRRHPTAHGLRIGKAGLERPPGEPPHPREEWERDGQYFHYLTRWMQALLRVAEATGEARYHRWAVELSEAASRAFVVTDPATGRHRMVWKTSVDLDRAQVASMGHHDPLDGWVTSLCLRASAHCDASVARALDRQAGLYADMCRGRDWTTADTLGIGGLLLDAWRLFRIRQLTEDVDTPDIEALLSAAASGLAHVLSAGELQRPAHSRLAFRELGLALGLSAARATAARAGDRLLRRGPLSALTENAEVGERLCAFWREPESRHTEAWREHADINDSMLVAALLPGGVLGEPVRPDAVKPDDEPSPTGRNR